MPGEAETFKSVISELTYGTDFELVNMLYAENANLTHEDLKTSIDKLENWWNFHLVSYDTFKSRGKPSNNGELSYCSCGFGICDESHRYNTENSVGRQIAMKARIEFKLQVMAMPESHSLYDWFYQMMWLLWEAPEDAEDDTVMEKHGAETSDSAVRGLMQAIRTEAQVAPQDAAHRMIQIAKPWTIRRWSELKLANG